MQRSRFTGSTTIAGLALVLLSGCNLVSPLAPLKATAIGSIDEVDGGVRPGKGMGNRPDEDAGMGDDGCNPPNRWECDPMAKCGCPSGQQCQYAVGSGAKCFAVTSNQPREGERCSTSSPCAGDLTCPATGICARRCATSDDCSVGWCGLLKTPLTTAGVQVCVHACDPVTGGDCNLVDGTTCVPTDDLSLLETALCVANRPGERLAVASRVNEACTSHTDCAPGLGCLATQMDGSGLCAPWCRTNDDCPESRAMCQIQNGWYYASASDPVGLCVPVQAGTPTDANCPITEPEPWMRGAVWTLSEFTDCLVACPEADNACVSTMCPGGAEFVACAAATLESCSGGSAGNCRPEYTGALCCQQQFCADASDVDACIQAYCAAQLSSWSMCASQDEDCTNDLASACVQ